MQKITRNGGMPQMSNTRRVWRITGFTGFLATLVLVAGFVYGIRTVLYPQGAEVQSVVPEEQNNAGQKDKIQILALGDSLTKGVGDDKGEGYVGKVKKLLEAEAEKPVYVWNFAVNGATTSDMLADISKPTSLDYISQADIILFTIGGNDLNRAATREAEATPDPTSAAGAPTPVPSVTGGSGVDALPDEIQFDFEDLARQLPEAVSRLNSIIDKLADMNPKALIVYVSLYHPFAEFDPDRRGAEWIGRWNNEAFQASTRHSNVTVVPTYDLFQNHWQELLYSDHFHPNGDAYEKIALRVAQVLKAGR
jgi:lysophospholipase L1-like esterase